MNKSALRKFAINARKELLERVELQARKIGITKDKIEETNIESSDAIFINGKPLTDVERRQRNKLINRIEEIGFGQVMEETAYTWFNRFIALRFMEVNDYLPTKVRALSSEAEGSTEPDMMKEALSLDLPIDKEYVYELRMENKSDELFKYLIKLHCNDLNRYMPFMFETVDDYKDILFPEGLLGNDSFIQDLINTEVILEEDWKEVEIIGWLYQYYIHEENDRVIRAKKRYKKEEIPFATQLFTPKWIVRYMVQNALGRYWVESHPEHQDLIENWEFYLESREEKDVLEEKLGPYINKELNVEDIKCFDPAMGSGHILVYMFDVLYEIYSKSGYMEREIPRLIIENNLYGLDIDDRAYQLASFSVVMKALQYNRRFLRSIQRDGLRMNLAAIQETNALTEEEITYLAGGDSSENYEKIKLFVEQFKHAKAIGSLIKIDEHDFELLNNRLKELEVQNNNIFELDFKARVLPLFKNLLKQTDIMNQKYDVFVTNPPYAGRTYLTKEVNDYLNKHYPDVKTDLFSSFVEYSFSTTMENGQIGFMTPYVWMFISSYEKLRKNIINGRNISSLIQLEYSGFDGATVPICTFTLRNYNGNTTGEYIRLSDFRGSENQPIKTLEAVQNPNVYYRYTYNQDDFEKIPGSPIAYWSREHHHKTYKNALLLKEIAEIRKGLTTGNTDKFIKFWFEVPLDNTAFKRNDSVGKKWFPCHKGGDYRKWYGNLEKVINWENDGYEIKNYRDSAGKLRSRPQNLEYMFRKGIVFSKITSAGSSCRLMTGNELFDDAVQGIFIKDDLISHEYLLALLNSPIIAEYLEILNPTMNKQINDLERIPILLPEDFNEFEEHSKGIIEIYKNDWDLFETSWSFEKHPLLKFASNSVQSSFKKWEKWSENTISELKENEKELNRIFIEIYGLQDELKHEVEDKDINIRKANLERDIKSFLSYAVGCMLGRYSLDEEGLIYAGGDFEPDQYKTYPADEDNIIPILSSGSFEDDILSQFIQFVQVTYGEDTLEENLNFIAEALGQRKNETARETIHRYFLNDFYKDHVQTYQKRPIYWLFTSGKEKAFNCLIYMHRYDKTTLSRIRTDYLHDVQARYDMEKTDLLSIIESDESTAKEVRDAKKELKTVEKKIAELKAYDEKLHHLADQQKEIELDKGVKENYEIFKGLVAKI